MLELEFFFPEEYSDAIAELKLSAETSRRSGKKAEQRMEEEGREEIRQAGVYVVEEAFLRWRNCHG